KTSCPRLALRARAVCFGQTGAPARVYAVFRCPWAIEVQCICRRLCNLATSDLRHHRHSRFRDCQKLPYAQTFAAADNWPIATSPLLGRLTADADVVFA